MLVVDSVDDYVVIVVVCLLLFVVRCWLALFVLGRGVYGCGCVCGLCVLVVGVRSRLLLLALLLLCVCYWCSLRWVVVGCDVVRIALTGSPLLLLCCLLLLCFAVADVEDALFCGLCVSC